MGQTLWLWAQRSSWFHDYAGGSGGRGRALFVPVAPEVAAVLAGATVLLVFWLARRLGGARAGVLAAAVFVLARAAGQGAGFGGTAAQTVAMALLLAGGWRALRFADDPSVGNGFAVGVVLGALPAFSRTGTMGGLAIAAWLVWQTQPRWRCWPVVLGLAGPVAGIVAVRGAELAATWAAYGRMVRDHGRSSWPSLGAELVVRLPDARGGLWLVWAGLGVAGLVALMLNWRRRADGVLLAGVAATMLLFLALGQSATWPGQYWILPVPFLVAAGACLVVRTVEQGALGARLAVGGVVVAQVALGSVVWSAHVSRERGAEVANVNARAFVEKNLAAGGVVIGPASIAGGVQAGDKWQFVDARRVGGDRRGAAAGCKRGARSAGAGGARDDLARFTGAGARGSGLLDRAFDGFGGPGAPRPGGLRGGGRICGAAVERGPRARRVGLGTPRAAVRDGAGGRKRPRAARRAGADVHGGADRVSAAVTAAAAVGGRAWVRTAGPEAVGYWAGLAFQTASVSGEPWLRTPLSVSISSPAASMSLRGKTGDSPPWPAKAKTMNSSRESRSTSTRCFRFLIFTPLTVSTTRAWGFE